jgi:hypothetical protein
LEVPLRSPPIAPDPAFSAAAAPIDAVHRRQMASGCDISSSQRICTHVIDVTTFEQALKDNPGSAGNPMLGLPAPHRAHQFRLRG